MDGLRLKILYISRGYNTHDHRFLGSFVGAGWETSFLPLLNERLDSRPVPGGVSTIPWPYSVEPVTRRDWVDRKAALGEVLAQTNASVVIAGPVQSGAFLAALAGAARLVTVSWGSDMLVDADTTAFMRFATRYALSRSDAVFGDCRAVREAVHRHSSLADAAIVTFPWGIDLAHFSPGSSSLSLRRKLGWTDNEVFISTRSWERVYAIDVLIRAFARLRHTRPEARLLLLGDGSLRNDVNRLVDQHELREFVHFAGRAPHAGLVDYFREADVYVSSALSDGTSVSLLEAMSCGLPVVAASGHGNLEWIEPGVNGALATPGDAEALATAMLSVMGNPRLRAAMGEANRSLVRKRANWNDNFPQLVSAVEMLASNDKLVSESR
ncbi:MAG: glycosyltransferase family 4 protein [Gemmatimonadaceae bacterium]|nr:glycosyltransferase family 4 protein [Gemmatimonadaceae bacterium]MDQ3243823.1 glycosyltransferase family 4 protein [Gemmatimonadota bacterium]